MAVLLFSRLLNTIDRFQFLLILTFKTLLASSCIKKAVWNEEISIIDTIFFLKWKVGEAGTQPSLWLRFLVSASTQDHDQHFMGSSGCFYQRFQPSACCWWFVRKAFARVQLARRRAETDIRSRKYWSPSFGGPLLCIYYFSLFNFMKNYKSNICFHLQIRFLHDPAKDTGFVGCALTSNMVRFFKKPDESWDHEVCWN